MRKKHSSELKSKVALEAIKGERTIAEIANQYGVHPNQIGKWKKQALENLPELFTGKREKKNEDSEVPRDDLFKEIGRLKVENEFLKKKYRQVYGEEYK